MAVEPTTGLLLIYHIAFASNWQPREFAMWALAILVGFEIMSFLVSNWGRIFRISKEIPERGQRLETLGKLDWTLIWVNRCISVVFVYHYLHFAWVWGHDGSNHVRWAASELTIFNTVGSWVAFHLVYDLVYCLFHRALHHHTIYRLVHKHHHKQMAPSRGNTDAINVHPFEFISGEYFHLLCVYLIPCHIYTVAFFIVAGGFMASLNHTRFDVSAPLGLYEVKYHDQHHAQPNTNYGQYTMFWDHVFRSYRTHPLADPGHKMFKGSTQKSN